MQSHAQVDYSDAASLEKFHNAHKARRHHHAAQTEMYYSCHHGDQPLFDNMQCNMQVHQNVMNLKNELPAVNQEYIGMEKQAQHQVAERLPEQQPVEQSRWKQQQDVLLDEALQEHVKEPEELYNQDEERRHNLDNLDDENDDPLHANKNPGSLPPPPSP